MSVWHMEAYRHTQVRSTPPLVEPSATKPYYTMSVWHGRMQMYPGQMYTTPLIEPSATEFCYTMSVWYVAEYRWTQIRPFCHNTHVNWLKCFHVTILNNWWSHIECYLEDLSEIIWWIIFISIWTDRTCIHLLLSTPDAGEDLWCSMNCAWWTFSLSTEKTSLYICLTEHQIQVINCHGHNSVQDAVWMVPLCVLSM